MASGQWPVGERRMREPVRSYRDLEVWALGMDIAESCYTLTRSFPQDERFGLTSQMRRAAASVPSNIAEGWGRDNRGDYIHMLRIAQGSLKELETQALLAQRLTFLSADDSDRLLHMTDSAGRMLRALIRSLGGS